MPFWSKQRPLWSGVENLPLIFDFGMNDAQDTLFYLRKGFRVLAVEADPRLVAKMPRDTKRYLRSGQLVVICAGIAETEGTLTFYRNLSNDGWSSFFPDYGKRTGKFEEIQVPTVTTESLLAKYGMPYYLKIDIEGHDLTVLRALAGMAEKPRYVSVEEMGVRSIDEMAAAGFSSFKIVNQRKHRENVMPKPPLEGKYVKANFDDRMTGPFGDEAPGEWLPLEEARRLFFRTVRDESGTFIDPESWWDVHGRS